MGRAPKLRLLSIPPIPISIDDEEELSGWVTPPLSASAAVPFLWEEEPGKPRPCTTLSTSTTSSGPNTNLELPPRMFMQVETPSPTTVLEGPYVNKRPKASSFRMTLKESMAPCPAPHGGTLLVSNRWLSKDKAWFWSSKRSSKIISPDYALSPCDSLYFDCDQQWDTTTAAGTSSVKKNTTGTHFWASIYGGLKHAISRKAKKLKDHNTLQ